MSLFFFASPKKKQKRRPRLNGSAKPRGQALERVTGLHRKVSHLHVIRSSSHSFATNAMGIFNNIFKWNQTDTAQFDVQLSASDMRLRQIIALAEAGNLDDFDTIREALQNDPDPHVRFAILKRFHHFLPHPDALTVLTKMQEGGLGKQFEPYFTMALFRCSLISEDEMNMRLNTP